MENKMSKNRTVSSRPGAVVRGLKFVNYQLPAAYCLLQTYLKPSQTFQLAALVIVTLLVSCGAKPDQTALVQEGKVLMEASDCKTCHHATNKIIGPPHAEVAKKYEFTDANVSMLAQRIIAGGSGVWGEIPMNAHPDMTKEDAEKIARYVLSLDGEQPK
jgi:cytochrome c551/c552